MIKKILIILGLLYLFKMCCGCCVPFDNWKPRHTTLLALGSVAMAVDAGQTAVIGRSYLFHETNPVMGENASRGRVAIIFGTAMLLNILIASIINEPYRDIWLSVVLGAESAAAFHNHNVGVRLW